MNPDVGSVLLLHPVVHRVLVLFRQLGGQQTVHLFPVVRMPAVGNQTADISGKLRLVLISEIVQHMAVDEIKRKSRLHIPAHHAARHGIVQKFLPLPGNVLHHQGLGIMLASGLILTRLRHVDRSRRPRPATSNNPWTPLSRQSFWLLRSPGAICNQTRDRSTPRRYPSTGCGSWCGATTGSCSRPTSTRRPTV